MATEHKPNARHEIRGDDEEIIRYMRDVNERLNDRIGEIRATSDTSGLDPAVRYMLESNMDDAQTHITRGQTIANANIDAAYDRMKLSDVGTARVNSIDTHPGVAPSGEGYGGTAGGGHASPTANLMSKRAARPFVGDTHTSGGGSVPYTPGFTPQQVAPAMPLRGGGHVPPQMTPMPSTYAPALNNYNSIVGQQRAEAEQRARAVQQQRMAQQREQQQALAAQRQQAMEERQKRLKQESDARRQELEKEADERKQEAEKRQAERVEKLNHDKAVKEAVAEWRDEINNMDGDSQSSLIDSLIEDDGDVTDSDEDTGLSHDEAVKMIEEALNDYYDDEPIDGVDAVDAYGGAYTGDGALPPAGGIGMPIEDVSFDNVNMGAMDESTIHAYIEDALDLNGWTPDPEVRSQVHALMYQMAMHESGGNPNAANGWDSNAVGPVQADGYPAQSSRGPWQCIPSTFSTYHVDGTSNSIYDPQASAAASLAYMMDKYGFDPSTGAGVAEFGSRRGIDVNTGISHGGYVGY